MERQLIFRHIEPSENIIKVLERYIDRHIEKFDHLAHPIGRLHIELMRDATDFICQCWGHFGRGDVVVKKKNGSIIGATVGALKALEMQLRKNHDSKVIGRKHARRPERINEVGLAAEEIKNPS